MQRIQRELDERKMKVVDLVRQSGANQSSVYNLMNGKYGIEPATLKAIGYVLDIPTPELAYYIDLTDEIPNSRQVLTDVFIAEWQKATPQRRNEILMMLRALNKLDTKQGGS